MEAIAIPIPATSTILAIMLNLNQLNGFFSEGFFSIKSFFEEFFFLKNFIKLSLLEWHKDNFEKNHSIVEGRIRPSTIEFLNFYPQFSKAAECFPAIVPNVTPAL